MAGAFDNFDPTGAKQKSQPAAASQQPAGAPAASGSGGAFGNFNPAGAAKAPPPPTQGQPDSGWGIDWNDPWYKGGPALKMPQSVQDFGDIAGNEAMAQNPANYNAARQRLGPTASAGADFAGNVLSPTTLLMGVGGPPLAGAVHEGLKSYASGNDWKTIGEDTLGGAGAGLFGQGVAKAAPVVLPQLTKAAIDLGPAAGMSYAAHKVFGEPSKDILGALGGYALMHNLSEGAGEAAKKVSEWAPTQQAIKNLILGGSSAFRQGAGPWDQWIPGQ